MDFNDLYKKNVNIFFLICTFLSIIKREKLYWAGEQH